MQITPSNIAQDAGNMPARGEFREKLKVLSINGHFHNKLAWHKILREPIL
jgi:hypothetical protein